MSEISTHKFEFPRKQTCNIEKHEDDDLAFPRRIKDLLVLVRWLLSKAKQRLEVQDIK